MTTKQLHTLTALWSLTVASFASADQGALQLAKFRQEHGDQRALVTLRKQLNELEAQRVEIKAFPSQIEQSWAQCKETVDTMNQAWEKMAQHQSNRSMLNPKDWYRVFFGDPEYQRLRADYEPLMQEITTDITVMNFALTVLARLPLYLHSIETKLAHADITWLTQNANSPKQVIKLIKARRAKDITAVAQGYQLKKRTTKDQYALIRLNRGIDKKSQITIGSGDATHDVSVAWFEQNNPGTPDTYIAINK